MLLATSSTSPTTTSGMNVVGVADCCSGPSSQLLLTPPWKPRPYQQRVFACAVVVIVAIDASQSDEELTNMLLGLELGEKMGP